MTPNGIDLAAPVVVTVRRLIAAPREAVWHRHIDIAGWPVWQEDVQEATLAAPFAPGAVFTWKTRGVDGPIRSTVHAVEPLARTLWGGPAGGVVGLHEWRFSDEAGATRVETAESWSGAAVEADVSGSRSALEESLERWLRFLERAVI